MSVWRMVWAALMVVSAVFLTGCVSYDYVGRQFEPLPEDAEIVYYNDRSDVPQGKYGVMGRITMTGPDNFDAYDIKDELLAKARDYGANAVCVMSVKTVKVGTYEISNDGFSGPVNPYNPANVNPDGSPIQVDSFGREVRLGGETRFRYEVRVAAIF
ncbi:MAG: hypothetical protein PHI35_09725, partial [Victivallaceae bacterium]|nr:hypothetical protein [Victivallaceae bacterium]